jgi:hypothetical protein
MQFSAVWKRDDTEPPSLDPLPFTIARRGQQSARSKPSALLAGDAVLVAIQTSVVPMGTGDWMDRFLCPGWVRTDNDPEAGSEAQMRVSNISPCESHTVSLNWLLIR